MKKLLLALTCIVVQPALYASQMSHVINQTAISVQHQKPTELELKRYWQGKIIGDLTLRKNFIDQEIFVLLKKYGEHIVNEIDPELHQPMLIYAANSQELGGWSLDRFEKLLQTPGIDLNTTNIPWTPFTKIISSLDEDENDTIQLRKLKLLITYGANVNQKNFDGKTPLLEAASENKSIAVALLLRGGASTDGCIEQGYLAGKTFFDFAQQYPDVQKAYTDYQKEKIDQQAGFRANFTVYTHPRHVAIELFVKLLKGQDSSEAAARIRAIYQNHFDMMRKEIACILEPSSNEQLTSDAQNASTSTQEK